MIRRGEGRANGIVSHSPPARHRKSSDVSTTILTGDQIASTLIQQGIVARKDLFETLKVLLQTRRSPRVVCETSTGQVESKRAREKVLMTWREMSELTREHRS